MAIHTTAARLLRIVRPLLVPIGTLRARLPRWMHRPGVLGIPLTPDGEVVLVRHTYLAGWHPPGGGRRRGESDEAAVIRELREEIGLHGWSTIERVDQGEAGLSVFVVRNVVYRPRASLEIGAIRPFAPDRLPADASPRLRRLLPSLGPASASSLPIT